MTSITGSSNGTRPELFTQHVEDALEILKADVDDDLTISSDYESDEEECNEIGEETNSVVEYRSKSVMNFQESMIDKDSLHLVRERLPLRKACTGSDDALSLSESDYESDIDSMCCPEPQKSQDEKNDSSRIDRLVDDLLLVSEKRSRERNQRRYNEASLGTCTIKNILQHGSRRKTLARNRSLPLQNKIRF